jgi:hypothetical protein|tara:strand:+ start:3029 stop:3247 length:219 start_codon:yes stop_codon:yes gene_type:complete
LSCKPLGGSHKLLCALDRKSGWDNSPRSTITVISLTRDMARSIELIDQYPNMWTLNIVHFGKLDLGHSSLII